MRYREPGELTLHLDEAGTAKCGLPHASFCRGSSLNVHSSLCAVGFLAAVSERLARGHVHQHRVGLPPR
jgi:hypothetical protein